MIVRRFHSYSDRAPRGFRKMRAGVVSDCSPCLMKQSPCAGAAVYARSSSARGSSSADPPASANIDQDLRNAAAYLDLLQQSEAGGELADADAFGQDLQQLFAPTETEVPGAVEVMTIHGAKGLQWDTVILPGWRAPLAAKINRLLYWRESVSEGQAHLLLAPFDSATSAGQDASVENYLRQIAADRGTEELKRLLYVACTRARSALHLLAELPEEGKDPRAGIPCSHCCGRCPDCAPSLTSRTLSHGVHRRRRRFQPRSHPSQRAAPAAARLATACSATGLAVAKQG